jgi:putative transcriptional regulator
MSGFGQDLIESLNEALAHAEGRSGEARIHVVETTDVREIRKSLRMSRQAFSDAYRIPVDVLKDWELGRSRPDEPATAYLQVIAKRPRETREALAT